MIMRVLLYDCTTFTMLSINIVHWVLVRMYICAYM